MPLPELRMSAIPRAALLVMLATPLVIAAAPSASAANPTMTECLTANESAIKLRGDHKLRQARDQSLVCSAETCPNEVREICQLRVRDLNAATPTIVFLAEDGAGQEVVTVKVSMDGEPIGDRLDGTALPVDPGEHEFRFETAGQPIVERSFVISQGQKDRRETIILGAPAPAAGAAPTSIAVSSPARGQRLAGIVVGATGVVGLGLGAVFGLVAASDWSSAKQDCNGQPVSCTTNSGSPGAEKEGSASTMATISTVGFIAGGVLAAGGVVVFLTAPKGSTSGPPAAAREVDLVPSIAPGAAGMWLRGRF
jgi:hypothetical protein